MITPDELAGIFSHIIRTQNGEVMKREVNKLESFENEIEKIVGNINHETKNIDDFVSGIKNYKFVKKPSFLKQKTFLLIKTDLLRLECSKQRYNELVREIANYHTNYLVARKKRELWYLRYDLYRKEE